MNKNYFSVLPCISVHALSDIISNKLLIRSYMISNEDMQSALRILELRAKVFDLNLKQKDLDYYGQTNEVRALDHKLYMLYKSITKYTLYPKSKKGMLF